jgi:hypothetical protein
MPTGWEHLTAYNNKCLPGEDVDNIGFLNKKVSPTDPNSKVTADLRLKQEEHFKAIIFYNHIPYESNELVFTNTV